MISSRSFSFRPSEDGEALLQRVRALSQTDLASVRLDAALDRLTRLATHSTSAPIALISMIETTRQVFVSAQGLPPELEETRQTPLSQSFCRYVVANDAVLVVEDVRSHPVVGINPGLLATGIVAYAGYPVHHPDGTAIGTICAADTSPRQWSADDLEALADLAAVLEADIAQRVERIAAERTTERMQGVMDAADDTAIVGADLHGLITFVNQGAVNLFDLRREQLVGVYHLEDLRRLGHPISQRDAPDRREDWLFADASGRQRVVSLRIATIRGADGAVTGSMLLCDDVSARHRTEELLRETLRKQAAVMEEMKTLDQARDVFIATASHELRTPITSIMGYTELLVDGDVGTLSPGQQDIVGRVHRNSERLLALIEDLLAISSHNATEQAPMWAKIRLEEIARRAWEMFEPHLVGRNLETTLEIADRLPTVRGDAAEVERVILNLLTNAAKYTPDNGTVRLVVEPHEDSVQVEVSDTGIGIAAEDQSRVFDPFFRAHEAHQRAIQGSGLGLALVRQLTAAHGGTVELTSKPNAGTTVRVRLPAHH